MPHVSFRFYAELNEHLPSPWRQAPFIHMVNDGATLGSAVESLGVPTNQIDLVLVNGESTGLSRELHDGDYLSLYPVFESFDIANVTKVRDKPLRTPRFVLDAHLGKLANHLRMLGFDTAFSIDADDAALITQSQDEMRTLLSKDRRLLQRQEITRRYCVRENDPRLQLVEVLIRFDLYGSVSPFTRCIECNTLLLPIRKEEVKLRIPERVDALFNEFRRCSACDRVYWKGSHYDRMNQFIDGVLHHRDSDEGQG